MITDKAVLTDLAERVEGARPVRVQLSRVKGWRMPPNTMSVARPSKWGNPFVVSPFVGAATVVEGYRDWLRGDPLPFLVPVASIGGLMDLRRELLDGLHELRGRNLACWCKEGPCHADVLLELANAHDPARTSVREKA